MVNNWLITGGCGFIGTSLIQALLETDPATNIRILDNLSVGKKSDLSEIADFVEVPLKANLSSPDGIELCVGDICDYEDVVQSCQGIDCIVHLAANTGVGPSVEDPRLDMIANVQGTFNLLEAARHKLIKSFVFASSGAPIGELERPPIHEELAPHPVSPYGASKLAGEGYCSAYYRSFGINTIALRFGNVYGPRSKNKSSVVAKFIKQAIAGVQCEIYGDGSQTRDFIYIDDLIMAIKCSVDSELGGEVFQIASSREVTINELVDVIQTSLSSNGISMKLFNGQKRLGDVQRNYSDTSKAKELLGWSPSVELADGVNRTISYFISLSKSSVE